MPTLLQINSTANWGSTGKIAEQINQTAVGRGWKTYIAYGREVNPSRSELIHVGDKLSQAVALAEARLFDNDGQANRIVTKRFIKKIKDIKPDIIHLHNLHGYYINYTILFEYLSSTLTPVVWTLHDCWAFTGHCGHFVRANCEKWKTHCADCPLKKAYPTSWWLDQSKRNYDLKKRLFSADKNLHIVAVSQWLAELVKQSYLKDADIRVINNGIDIQTFRPNISENRTKFSILGVSSVWTESKGLHDFYRLRETLSADRYDITLVGLSDNQIKLLPEGIKGIARTNSVEELVHYYNSADVVLSLSYGESMGLTPVEGMACGTPAIVYNNTAQPELVTPNTGIVVNQGNIQELCQAIYTVQNNGKQYYSSACRNRAETYYNKEDRYQEYVDLYKELISK